jgi:hypothetical protein
MVNSILDQSNNVCKWTTAFGGVDEVWALV